MFKKSLPSIRLQIEAFNKLIYLNNLQIFKHKNKNLH